ncbi:MAG TPA: NAD-dependent epimerase/dehydratase family protein [Polyangiaceae bacterium]|jgi:nucleoside-diphosphate-sugar epimerase
MSELHVILGAGQVGTVLARELLARGKRVRQVRRGAPGQPREGLEWLQGDVSDLSFAGEATRGATVVYDCVNPAYDRWVELLPPMRRGILHGTVKSGAKLVQLDNLYMYGAPEGPITETTPMAPVSRKGELRARLAEETLVASRRDGLRVAMLRASDFYGPEFLAATIFGPHFYDRVLAGKSALCQGDPDMPHTYSYGPDVARAMVTLGEAGDDVLGQVWHVLAAPAEPTRATIQRFGRALGLGRDVRVQRVGDWLLQGIGVFAPFMREVAEMTYQWKKPFVLDDSKWRARFGGEPTPLQAGVDVTAFWALGRSAARRKAA